MGKIKDMCKGNNESVTNNEPAVESDIQKFFAGKTIFITGSTGFMGKCLVEKLLRGCPDIKRLYVLVRQKRDISPEDRIKKYFDHVLFDLLRGINPDFASKVYLIEGDLVEDSAFSTKDREMLIEEVNIIFHNASNVKFNEPLNKILKINVMGTQAMLDFAKECKHIEGFMYVSTAFSHCYRKNLTEEAYPPPADLKMVKELIAVDLETPGGINEAAIKSLLGAFPNTYAFTKATAEGLVHEAGKHVSFPCIVYRPSIVISAWKEPIRGWCGNQNGPGYIFVGYGLGLIHGLQVENCVHDLIPVDMSINIMLVLMWDVVKQRPSGPLVYNYASSKEKPIRVLAFRDLCEGPDSIIKNPSIHMVWQNFIILTRCFWYSLILHLIFHFIPAVIVDSYLMVKGKKPQILPGLKKVLGSYSTLEYFVNGGWVIDMSQTNKSIDRMSSIDQELFNCDIRKLEWEDYCSSYWDGLRLYVLKDPMSTVPAAERKYRRIRIAHKTIKYMSLLLVVYLIARFIGLL